MTRKARDLAGQRFGSLTVVVRHGTDGQGGATWYCACDCGGQAVFSAQLLLHRGKRACNSCTGQSAAGRPISKGMWPGISRLPWEEDEIAQSVVAAFPGGMTLEQVGLCFGVNRERVRQIESKALRKLAAMDAEDAAAPLALAEREASDEAEESDAFVFDEDRCQESLMSFIERLASAFLLPRGRSARRFA
jgi:hypothetical protein